MVHYHLLKQVDFLHPTPFNGSTCTYIERGQPDVVLMALSEGNMELVEADRFY